MKYRKRENTKDCQSFTMAVGQVNGVWLQTWCSLHELQCFFIMFTVCLNKQDAAMWRKSKCLTLLCGWMCMHCVYGKSVVCYNILESTPYLKMVSKDKFHVSIKSESRTKKLEWFYQGLKALYVKSLSILIKMWYCSVYHNPALTKSIW